jgi:hypothetical protein
LYPSSHWPDAADNLNPTAANFWGGWGGWSPSIDQLSRMGLAVQGGQDFVNGFAAPGQMVKCLKPLVEVAEFAPHEEYEALL